MCDHGGSFVIIVFAGVVGYFIYPDVADIFYIIGAGGIFACTALLLLPLSNPNNITLHNDDDVNGIDSLDQTDHDGNPSSLRTMLKKAAHSMHGSLDESRVDYATSRNLNQGDTPATFTTMLKDKDIILFGLSVFFFHLGNAAVLPSLSQIMVSVPLQFAFFVSSILASTDI